MAEIIEMRRVRPRFEPVYEPLKNCLTCGHRAGSMCLASGYSYEIERRCPTVCGVNFDRWTFRPPSRWQRFKRWAQSLSASREGQS